MKTSLDKSFSSLQNFKLLGAGFGHGAQLVGTRYAPCVFKKKGIDKILGIEWHSLLEDETKAPKLGSFERMCSVIRFNKRLAQDVYDILENAHRPLVIGGDHSVALGTWFGVSQYLRKNEKLGLVWIDAHLDSHTFKTSPSQAIHGMPVATLLGYGEEAFQKAFGTRPVVDPQNLVFIGVRSYEEGEYAFLKKLGVKIFYMSDINARGFESILETSLELVSRETDCIGLSLDMDVFDPEEVPAVGSPEEGGLFLRNVLPALSKISHLPNLIAFEIAELNPELDKQGRSFTVAEELLVELFSKRSPS